MLTRRSLAFAATSVLVAVAVLVLVTALPADAPRVRPIEPSGETLRPPIVSIRAAPPIAKVALPPKKPKTRRGDVAATSSSGDAVSDPVIEAPLDEIRDGGGQQESGANGTAPPAKRTPPADDVPVDEISG